MNAVVAQHDFAAALLDPERIAPHGLRVRAGVDPQRRFAIHRNNAIVAIVDALASAFPVTRALVGVEFFRAMTRERVRIDPPRSPILTDYGDGFADFIAAFAPAAEVLYLADIARLECLRALSFHAADALPLTMADYHALAVDPGRLAATRLILHPACGWLRSEHAVHSIWNAHQGLADPRDAELEAIAIDAPEAVLVARPQLDVLVAPVPEYLIAAFDALRDGCELGEAIASDGIDGNQFTARFEALLQLIIRHGLAVALDPPTEY